MVNTNGCGGPYTPQSLGHKAILKCVRKFAIQMNMIHIQKNTCLQTNLSRHLAHLHVLCNVEISMETYKKDSVSAAQDAKFQRKVLPTYMSRRSDSFALMKPAWHSPAAAFTTKVFPHPGGPYIMMPPPPSFPYLRARSGFIMG